MRTFGHPWKRRSHCSFVLSPVGLDHDRCSVDNKIIWVSELVLRDVIRRVLMVQLSDRIDPRTHQLVPKVRSSPTLHPPPAARLSSTRTLLFFPHLQASNVRAKDRPFVSCVQKLSLQNRDVTVLTRAWFFVRRLGREKFNLHNF
jgi:hypothetical protein